MIHESIASCVGQTPLVNLSRLFKHSHVEVLAKLELMNPGSVKDRPARLIIERGLQDGTITSATHLLESSSGSFGLALAMMARLHGLRVTIVVDPKIAGVNLRMLQLFGADIDMVDERDENGGYLKTRIRRVHELMGTLPNALFVNQYAHTLNWRAHYEGEGAEILAALDRPIDVLALAVSTSGTIMGISRRLREAFPRLHVVAIDALGSIIFGAPPGSRELPGIGSSRIPEILSPDEIDEVIYVSDLEAAAGCRQLLTTEGIFAGGSSGSVVAGIAKLIPTLPPGARVVTLLPDRGERYMDTVYNDDWVAQLAAAKLRSDTPLISRMITKRAA